VLLNAAGLHGAKVVITGRRQQVLTDSCAALAGEGIAALGVQVLPMSAGWLCCTPACGPFCPQPHNCRLPKETH